MSQEETNKEKCICNHANTAYCYPKIRCACKVHGKFPTQSKEKCHKCGKVTAMMLYKTTLEDDKVTCTNCVTPPKEGELFRQEHINPTPSPSWEDSTRTQLMYVLADNTPMDDEKVDRLVNYISLLLQEQKDSFLKKITEWIENNTHFGLPPTLQKTIAFITDLEKEI